MKFQFNDLLFTAAIGSIMYGDPARMAGAIILLSLYLLNSFFSPLPKKINSDLELEISSLKQELSAVKAALTLNNS